MLSYLHKLEAAGAPPPCFREICVELGYQSTNAAKKLINRLRDAGDVTFQPGRARTLKLAKTPETGVPLLGSIAAGFPDNQDVGRIERLQFNPLNFGIRNPTDAFALRVRGDSMTGRQFFDGDLVLLDRSAKPKNQDVVAALIDQECTLKTLVVRNGKAWLKAENPAYPDIIPAHDLQIQGVAKAVIRILAA
ncbi:MAG: transcriptional repressor LexA [Luteolibacter sp.]|uniref:transcriptional repressor LexA n=1 Tax=Luteolibacter sp. TaxID=1962973 RepID=UPI0032666BD3